jgi:hypothetical protein
VNLETNGATFDGAGVIYIDVDGGAAGIDSTEDLLLNPYRADLEGFLPWAVAGQSKVVGGFNEFGQPVTYPVLPPLLDNTDYGTAPLLPGAPLLVDGQSAERGWTFTTGSSSYGLSSVSFGLYAEAAGSANVGVRLYQVDTANGTRTLVDQEEALPVSLGPVATFESWTALGWELKAQTTYSIVAYAEPADGDPVPLLATSAFPRSAYPGMTGIAPTDPNFSYAAEFVPVSRVFDTTADLTELPQIQAAGATSLREGPQGWTFAVSGTSPVFVDTITFGLYADSIDAETGAAAFNVGLRLYSGAGTGGPVLAQTTTEPVVLFSADAPDYLTREDLGWILQPNATYTIAAYEGEVPEPPPPPPDEPEPPPPPKPFLAITNAAVGSAGTLSQLVSTAGAGGPNYAFFVQPPVSYQSVLTFTGDFKPDYAIAFNRGVASLFELNDGFPFINQLADAAVRESVVGGKPAYEFAFTLADLGLSSTVADGFNFAASYLAGPSLLGDVSPQGIGAYRTNQSVGFSVAGANPGSVPSAYDLALPNVGVTSSLTYTQQLANFVGGKSIDPLLPGATNFRYVGGSFEPKNDAPVTTDWLYGSTRPLDGLVAATALTSNRNFMPLAFLTNVTSGRAELYLPTVAGPV